AERVPDVAPGLEIEVHRRGVYPAPGPTEQEAGSAPLAASPVDRARGIRQEPEEQAPGPPSGHLGSCHSRELEPAADVEGLDPEQLPGAAARISQPLQGLEGPAALDPAVALSSHRRARVARGPSDGRRPSFGSPVPVCRTGEHLNDVYIQLE